MSDALADRAAPAVEALRRGHRLRPWEALPWLAAVAAFFVFPDYLALGAQILINDPLRPVARSDPRLCRHRHARPRRLLRHRRLYRRPSRRAWLGRAAERARRRRRWSPGLVGLVSGAIILRTRGLTLLMLTLVIAVMLQEAANKAGCITGGADGLQGMNVAPVLGLFRFDLFGRTAYLYCLAVLFLGWLARAAHRAFAVRPLAHRHPRERGAHARDRLAGVPAAPDDLRDLRRARRHRRRVAGADDAVRRRSKCSSFERSGAVLIMLILGGVGRLYGAFIGVPLYMIAQDQLAQQRSGLLVFLDRPAAGRCVVDVRARRRARPSAWRVAQRRWSRR